VILVYSLDRLHSVSAVSSSAARRPDCALNFPRGHCELYGFFLWSVPVWPLWISGTRGSFRVVSVEIILVDHEALLSLLPMTQYADSLAEMSDSPIRLE